MPPDPKTPNVDDTNVMSDIDSMLDEDAEFYDDGDTGTDTGSDGDGGGTGVDTAGAEPSTQQQRVPAQDEPPLPMEMPTARPPSTPTYDPDNPKGFQRVGTLFADKDGNIVSRDGRVMAAKGEPARHWFNMSKQAATAVTAQRQVEALNKTISDQQRVVNAAKELNDLPQKLGISRDDYNIGVQLMAAWNRDPLTVCRDLVARTMARGINATDIIGNEAGNAIEMTALRRMVDEATAGTRQREEAIRVDTESRTAAETKYNEFMARYPQATPHVDAIAELMRNNKITAQEAFHELRFFALEQQLDFNQPLGPQILARQRAQQPAPQREQTYRAPMVAGNGGGNRGNHSNDTQFADPNSSWGEILNNVMRASA